MASLSETSLRAESGTSSFLMPGAYEQRSEAQGPVELKLPRLRQPKRLQWQPRRNSTAEGSRRQNVSWLLSTFLHLTLLALLLFVVRPRFGQPVGFRDGEQGPIGLEVQTPGEYQVSGDADDKPESVVNDSGTTPLITAAPSVPSPFAGASAPSSGPPPAAPLLPLPDVPAVAGSAIGGMGTGAAFGPPVGTPFDPRDIVRGTGIRESGSGGKSGLPGATFMGIKDEATRIVFVIDSSGSMVNHNAMRVAKSSLASSLQSLDSAQQFQVIFYNEAPTPIRLKNEAKIPLYFATEINKTLARQYISGVQPDHGTQHLAAIKMALRMGPEVIFLLTDADDPQLSAAERNEIRQLNHGVTRIHTIEFGKGPQLNVDNWLQKLARENGGTHRYEDITLFDRR